MTTFTGIAWSVYRWALDVFLPPQCVLCGKVETWLCDACAPKIPQFTAPLCPRCGRASDGGALCRVCQEMPLHVAPIRSAYLFQENIRDVLHALKYRGGKSVVDPLAQPMAEVWHKHALSSVALLPVPLHPKRLQQRGYNQAEVLARSLSREIGIPVFARALERVRDTPSQTRFDRQERRQNVREAFVYTAGETLVGKQVTLVDDVATTGATLDACAMVLLAQGIASVNAFTLARAS